MNPVTLYNPIADIHKKLLNKETNAYVLIDVNSDQRLRGELFNLTDAPKFHNLFHGTVLQELRDQSPFLVQIELNQYRYLSFLFENSPEYFMLIFSEHTLETLYQHWQSLLTVKALDGDIAIYKFYTPQFLSPYLDACKPYEQARLLAFCDELYLYDEQDSWTLQYQANPELRTPLTDLKKVHPELETAWWQVQEEHLIYLQHITDKALQSNMENYMVEFYPELLQPYEDRDINQMIRHAIRRGRYYELKTQRDFAFYIGIMFELGPSFDEHPKIHQWLYQWDKKEEVSTMSDELADHIWDEAKEQFDDQAWTKMQKDYSYKQPQVPEQNTGAL